MANGTKIRSIPISSQLSAFIVFFLKLQLTNWMSTLFVVIFPFIFYIMLYALKELLYWLTEGAPLRIGLIEVAMTLFATSLSQPLQTNASLPYLIDQQSYHSTNGLSIGHSFSATSTPVTGLTFGSIGNCHGTTNVIDVLSILSLLSVLGINLPLKISADSLGLKICKEGTQTNYTGNVHELSINDYPILDSAIFTVMTETFYLHPEEQFSLNPEFYTARNNQINFSIMGPLAIHNLDNCNFTVYTRDCPLLETNQAITGGSTNVTEDTYLKSTTDMVYRAWYQLRYASGTPVKTAPGLPEGLPMGKPIPQFKVVDYVLIPDVRWITDVLMEQGSYLVLLFIGHIVIPLITVLLVTQACTGFTSLIYSSGLHPAVYYLTFFIYYYLVSLSMSLINVFASMAFSMDSVNKLGGLLVIITFTYPLFSIPLAFAFAMAFKSVFSAAIISWFSVIFVPQMILLLSKVLPFKINVLAWFLPLSSLAYITSSTTIDSGAINGILAFCAIQCAVYGPVMLFLEIYLTARNIAKRKGLLKSQQLERAELTIADDDQENVAVAVSNLSKTFKAKSGYVHAVKNLSFQVRTGEIFSLLGHNGCGKSTTVNMIAGAIPLTSGSIKLNGYLCFAPQYDVLPNDTRVDHVMTMFGRMRGLSKKECEKEMDDLLTALNLRQFKHKTIKQCSGGSQRRISFACACIGTKPLDVVLCDEITTGLSRTDAMGVWNVLLGLQKRNISVILISHDLDEAEMLSTNVLFMSGGRGIKQGNPMELCMSTEYQICKIKSTHSIPELESFVTDGRITCVREAGDLIYQIKLDVMTPEEVFDVALKHEDCFVDNVGLEDVFFAIESYLHKEQSER